MSHLRVCDWCGNEMPKQQWWLTPPKAGVDPYLDFDRLACLIEWAADRDDPVDPTQP